MKRIAPSDQMPALLTTSSSSVTEGGWKAGNSYRDGPPHSASSSNQPNEAPPCAALPLLIQMRQEIMLQYPGRATPMSTARVHPTNS